MNATNSDFYHQIGEGYVKTPTSVTDPYPCLLQPEGLSALERYKLFWLYCHTFIVFPRGPEAWKWQSQLGVADDLIADALFCQAFTEIYARTRAWLAPEKCVICPLRESPLCPGLTYDFQFLLKKGLFCTAQDYAWNMLNFWSNPAGRLRDIEKIRNESGVFLRRELPIPEIFIPYPTTTTNQPSKELNMHLEKFTGEIFAPVQVGAKKLPASAYVGKAIANKTNPFPLVEANLTPLNIYQLYWTYASQVSKGEFLWEWDWHKQFNLLEEVTIWNIFCTIETTVMGEVASCIGCYLYRFLNCGEVVSVYNYAAEGRQTSLAQRMARALRDFWDNPQRACCTLAKLIGEAEYLTIGSQSKIPSAEDNLEE